MNTKKYNKQTPKYK